MMPLFFNDRNRRLGFQVGRQSGLRSTNEVVEQLQEQLRAAHEQNAFNCREYEKQIATLLHDLLEAKYELAKRDREIAFAAAPSPSAMVH
jgi:hypothetical protein